MEREEIFTGKVQRYVWHISFKENRSSIDKQGLLPISSKGSHWEPIVTFPSAVFVNNHDDYSDWFHLDESRWIPPYLENKDVWLIDTQDIDTTWYIDFNLTRNGDYLFTKDAIPRERLTLFTLNEVVCEDCKRIIEGLPLETVLCHPHCKRNTTKLYAHDECLRYMYKDEFDIHDWVLKKNQNKIRTGVLVGSI